MPPFACDELGRCCLQNRVGDVSANEPSVRHFTPDRAQGQQCHAQPLQGVLFQRAGGVCSEIRVELDAFQQLRSGDKRAQPGSGHGERNTMLPISTA